MLSKCLFSELTVFKFKRSLLRCSERSNSMNAVSEPTWRCHQNPFVGALGIQEPVILGEPQIKG